MTHVYYHRHDVNDEASYQSLLTFSNELDKQYQLQGNRLFLFSYGTLNSLVLFQIS